MNKLSSRRGFTILFTFLVLLTIVFAYFFNQTNRIATVGKYQKKVYTNLKGSDLSANEPKEKNLNNKPLPEQE